jgi:hypothetical protein
MPTLKINFKNKKNLLNINKKLKIYFKIQTKNKNKKI